MNQNRMMGTRKPVLRFCPPERGGRGKPRQGRASTHFPAIKGLPCELSRRGSVGLAVCDRSPFPTWAAKSDTKRHQFPTNAGPFSGIFGKRWGVLSACAAKRRKASNGADFSTRKSLHIRVYRKIAYTFLKNSD